VLESIPARLAELISTRLSIPTIGIGAGPNCDGQVLVTHDLLGMFDRFTPRFVKQYAQIHSVMEQAFSAFKQDIVAGQFPTAEHSFSMSDEAWAALKTELEQG
jgi:3-methyl-2-oxobutanoate hydroxymethyltransferase